VLRAAKSSPDVLSFASQYLRMLYPAYEVRLARIVSCCSASRGSAVIVM